MDYGPAYESADEAVNWLAKHEQTFGFFINGNWHKPKSLKHFESIDPCTEKKLANIAQASDKEVDLAVRAALKAKDTWASLSCFDRSKYLYALARELQKNARLFAVLESLDNGKTIRETRDIDIPLVIRHFYYHAGCANEREAAFPDHQPIGVVGQIIPWNFPLLMLAWKVAPALAMGNTIVLKPAEQTSLTALLFAEICQQIDLPAGVLNIVTGDGKTGQAIVEHPDIQKIAFTGSTEVGRWIQQHTAGSGKKLTLELGGKSPFIIFEDADLDGAVEGIVDAIWFNQGQVCCAGSRLLVQESIADRLHEKLKTRMKKLRLGSSLDKNADIGAIISEKQLKQIGGFVERAEREGLTCWQTPHETSKKGFYFPPTLFEHVSPGHEIAQKEIFGPVLVSTTFREHAEAIALANNTNYGLAASVWTENINLALAMAPQIQAGTVWVNCTNMFDAGSGFGGYKESGYGREGGKEGLYAYLKPKEQQISSSADKKRSGGQVNSSDNFKDEINRTAKLYIGGKQQRPDGGYSMFVRDAENTVIGEVAKGNRKDIRNAVEAAQKEKNWSSRSGHERAQVLYYIAENLAARKAEFAARLQSESGSTAQQALQEMDLAISALFSAASMADKYDGAVHSTLKKMVTLAMPEAIGVLGLLIPEVQSFLTFIKLAGFAIAMGNKLIAVPPVNASLSITDFYQVLETSDLPGGVLNIVTGDQSELAEVLAKHEDVDGIWYPEHLSARKIIEMEAAYNMKRIWAYNPDIAGNVNSALTQDQLMRNATQIKNIWIPYGI